MPQHCTHCNITWSDATVAAHSPQRGYTEEVIEVCPKCYSGLDLHSIVSKVSFSLSFTGVITNDLTGKVLEQETKLPVRKSWKPHEEPQSAWAAKMYSAFEFTKIEL